MVSTASTRPVSPPRLQSLIVQAGMVLPLFGFAQNLPSAITSPLAPPTLSYAAPSAACLSPTPPTVVHSAIPTNDSQMYVAEFHPQHWSGDIKKYTLQIDSTGNLVPSPEIPLSAAQKLDALTASALDRRKIFIGDPVSTSTSHATAFQWGFISDRLKHLLNTHPISQTLDDLGEARLAFLRGSRDREGLEFRERSSRLGDILHAAVVYSGAPSPPSLAIDPAYHRFEEAKQSRIPVIYAGANDGMLHAFHATTLDELFAYIPSWLSHKLTLLTASDYNSYRHTSYVDATPFVTDAPIQGHWKTLLIGSSGLGGPGIFALDVSDPENFDASKLLWEFTDANDPSLANMVGTPRILKFRSHPNTSTTAEPNMHQWFAVIPSGIRSVPEERSANSMTSQEPALFFLDISKPPDTPWRLGENYFKVVFPMPELTPTEATTMVPPVAGVIHFEATGHPDDSVEFIYIGDLHGHLWKLDMSKANFTSTHPQDWSLDRLSYFSAPDGKARPLYIARNAAGQLQPISLSPSIAFGPDSAYLVAFGTGAPRETISPTPPSPQSFYVLYDLPHRDLDTQGLARFNGRSRLQPAFIDDSGLTMAAFEWVTPAKTTADAKAGWYIDFPRDEQLAAPAQLAAGNIIFSTTQSAAPTATMPCPATVSYIYTASLSPSTAHPAWRPRATQGTPRLFSLPSRYRTDATTGQRFKTDAVGILSATPLQPSQHLPATLSIYSTEVLTGRLSWRHIHNYQALRHQKRTAP